MILSDVEECLASAKRVPDSSRPFLAAIILLFTFVGVITNLVLLSVFICRWKSTFRSQYFTFFVLNMIIAGTVFCLTNLCVSVPCTINKCPFIKSDEILIALSTPNTWGYWTYLFSSFAFTIYRFGIFMSSSFGERKRCIKIIQHHDEDEQVLHDNFSPDFKELVDELLKQEFGCTIGDKPINFAMYTKGGFSFVDFNQYAGQLIPVIMVTAYAIILFSVYRNRRSRGSFNRRQSLADAKLAFQFIIICGFQYLNVLLFFIMAGHSSDWSIILRNTIGTINVSVNPIVLLLWNQQVRSSAIVIFGRRQVRTVTEVTRLYFVSLGALSGIWIICVRYYISCFTIPNI